MNSMHFPFKPQEKLTALQKKINSHYHVKYFVDKRRLVAPYYFKIFNTFNEYVCGQGWFVNKESAKAAANQMLRDRKDNT